MSTFRVSQQKVGVSANRIQKIILQSNKERGGAVRSWKVEGVQPARWWKGWCAVETLCLMGRTKGTGNGIFFRWVGRFDSVCRILLFLVSLFFGFMRKNKLYIFMHVVVKKWQYFMDVTVEMVIKIYQILHNPEF
jgi:hypothetical protein